MAITFDIRDVAPPNAAVGSTFINRTSSLTYFKLTDGPHGWIPITTITSTVHRAICVAVACVGTRLDIARDAYIAGDSRALECLVVQR